MFNINEGDKIRMTTGEIALISDVLESGVAYIAEVFRKSNGFSVSIDQIRHDEIASVFVETERPMKQPA